ncbi:FadR family transcriptional regulator [Rothia sp. ZJ932]|nr:FadR family transcriptional regulator [Rothia sp. ZJ932]
MFVSCKDVVLLHREKSFTQLLEVFERKLRSGELVVGDRLPGERTLAETYGVSRASVREALRVLDAVGLITTGVGSGPKAGSVVVSEPSEALGWALRMHLATSSLPVADVISTRLHLEGPAMVEAAAAPDSLERDAALQRAGSYLDEMDDPQITDERFHFCDTRFHYELAAVGSNLVMKTIIDSLRIATISYVQEAVPHLEDWQAVKRTLQEQHRGILAAVVDRRPQDARARLEEHILWFSRQSLSFARP